MTAAQVSATASSLTLVVALAVAVFLTRPATRHARNSSRASGAVAAIATAPKFEASVPNDDPQAIELHCLGPDTYETVEIQRLVSANDAYLTPIHLVSDNANMRAGSVGRMTPAERRRLRFHRVESQSAGGPVVLEVACTTTSEAALVHVPVDIPGEPVPARLSTGYLLAEILPQIEAAQESRRREAPGAAETVDEPRLKELVGLVLGIVISKPAHRTEQFKYLESRLASFVADIGTRADVRVAPLYVTDAGKLVPSENCPNFPHLPVVDESTPRGRALHNLVRNGVEEVAWCPDYDRGTPQERTWAYDGPDYPCYAYVPMLVRGRCVGLVQIESRQRESFSARYLNAASLAARFLGAAYVLTPAGQHLLTDE